MTRAEKNQVVREMKEMAKCLRSLGIDFMIVLNTGERGGKHNISCDIGVRDDHHYMDMMAAICEAWWKANHE